MELKPSYFAAIPLIRQKTANEIISYLANTGDTFRKLTWEEYKPVMSKIYDTKDEDLLNNAKRLFEQTYHLIETAEKCVEYDPLWFVPMQNYNVLIEVFHNKPYASKRFCNETHKLESNIAIRDKYRELLPFLTDAQILATMRVISKLHLLQHKTSYNDIIHWEYDVENIKKT